MITSDTAVYLVGETDFRNYIVATYGLTKANEILHNMAILSTIASLGTNGIAGSGILKTYSRVEALKLVGTGEAILKDSIALEKLSSTEIAALKEAITKVKKELYSIRNTPDAIETIVNTKATVFFNKFADLETGINTLSQANKLLFYNKFVSISEKELNILRSVWLGSNDIARLEIIQNSDLWLKYIKIRDYLKNDQFSEVAKIFNVKIVEAEIPVGYPNLRYLDLEDDILNTIAIANRTDDTALIHQFYPEIPIHIINRVKKHYYLDNHLFFEGQNFKIGRFGRNSLENLQWQDAAQGFLFGQDLNDFKWLIAHEYIEAKLMEKGVNFRSYVNSENVFSYDSGAHWLSPLKNNITNEITYWNVHRLDNPPFPNLNNFSNLDEIVNWYVNFYKL